MAYITPQELTDASVDAETLDKFANGLDGEPNINRAGNDVSNLATIRAEALAAAQAASNLHTYLTKAAMDADTGQDVGATGRVTNDATAENNGDYVWNGTAWVWSEIQPASTAQVQALDAQVQADIQAVQDSTAPIFHEESEKFVSGLAAEAQAGEQPLPVAIDEDGDIHIGAVEFESRQYDPLGYSLPVWTPFLDAAGNVLFGILLDGDFIAGGVRIRKLDARVQALEGGSTDPDDPAVQAVQALGARGTITRAQAGEDGFYRYASDVSGALLPYLRKTSGTQRAHVLDTSAEMPIHISYGQSWRSNSFDGARSFVGDIQTERYLTPYKSGGAEDGPLTTGAGISVGGTITDLANISSNEPLSIGRMAIETFLRWQDQLRRRKVPIAEFCHAYPGSSWTDGGGGGLAPGGTSWTNGLTIMNGLEAQLANYGKTPVYRSVAYTQGGNASRTFSENVSDLKAMMASYDALNLPGTDSMPLNFYIGLTGGNASTTEMTVGQRAWLQVCRENANGRTWLSTPWYQWHYRQTDPADNIHTDAYGTVRHGEMEGYAKFCVEELGLAWNPLWHSRTDAITIDGAVITVQFERPSGPAFETAVLGFDTETIEQAESYGFRVYVNSTKATIASVEIAGLLKTDVKITLDTAPQAGDTVEVSYAGRDGTAQPAGTHSGLWGNLVMKGATSVLNPRWTLDAWACNFIESITA